MTIASTQSMKFNKYKYIGGWYCNSYGYNEAIGGATWHINRAALSMSQIKQPTDTPLFTDANEAYGNYWVSPSPMYDGGFHPYARHSEMSVLCFVDGHVKAIKVSEWSAPMDFGASGYNTDPVWKKWDPTLQ